MRLEEDLVRAEADDEFPVSEVLIGCTLKQRENMYY